MKRTITPFLLVALALLSTACADDADDEKDQQAEPALARDAAVDAETPDGAQQQLDAEVVEVPDGGWAQRPDGGWAQRPDGGWAQRPDGGWAQRPDGAAW